MNYAEGQRPTIENPILRGFNPDPSILRVGDDYYIATSTFEWYPGVQIHHSRDLVHWRLLTRPLRRSSQLDMRGEPDSCGIWAPCLSHANGLFHLIYTDVKRYGGTGASGVAPRDMHNYLVTTSQIDGDWSDPIHLNSSGFDPSLFHDDDGKMYLVNMLWDHRPHRNRFAGIVCQQYCSNERKLLGTRTLIFKGTKLGLTEAPHLYKRQGYYYLVTAEGGTGFDHAVTVGRSRSVYGPYEVHPEGPLLTSHNRPDAQLQRAGHADWVDTPDGETYMVYLCGRPLPGRGRCTLGRETAIVPLEWHTDHWPRLQQQGADSTDGQPALAAPRLEVQGPRLKPHPFAPEPTRDHFNSEQLGIHFQWLRCAQPDAKPGECWFSLRDRPGHLRLYGRESLGSQYVQALIARRWQSHSFSAITRLEFEPQHFQQMAGLVAYYGGSKYHYLCVSHDEQRGKQLQVLSRSPVPEQHDKLTTPIALKAGQAVELRMEVDNERLLFAYRLDGQPWTFLPQSFDASILSDEAATGFSPHFTGAFVGMCCQDLAGTGRPADFDYFQYLERPYSHSPATIEVT